MSTKRYRSRGSSCSECSSYTYNDVYSVSDGGELDRRNSLGMACMTLAKRMQRERMQRDRLMDRDYVIMQSLEWFARLTFPSSRLEKRLRVDSTC